MRPAVVTRESSPLTFHLPRVPLARFKSSQTGPPESAKPFASVEAVQ